MAPAASQFRRTASDNRRYWGRLLNEKTDGEEARGGERDARAGKVVVDMELGRVNLGGGGRGGTTAVNGTRVNSSKYRPESSVWVAAVRGWNSTTL